MMAAKPPHQATSGEANQEGMTMPKPTQMKLFDNVVTTKIENQDFKNQQAKLTSTQQSSDG